MKLFGEFLVEKKVVDSAGLASALVEQIRAIPPACEVVHRLKLVNSDQLLAIFRKQQEEGIEFLAAARSFEFWNSDAEKSLQAEWDQSRVPIGQILVKRGATDLQTLTKMLDEFLSNVKPEEQANKPPANTNQVSGVASGTAAPLSAGTLAELEGNFTETKKEEMINLLHLVEQNVDIDELVKEFLSDFLKSIHSLKGMCKLLGLGPLEGLISGMADITTKILDGSAGDNATKARKASQLLSALDLAWDIRQQLIKGAALASFNDKINLQVTTLES